SPSVYYPYTSPPVSYSTLFRSRFAYKTGTSYGYRDAWAIGYDGAHTIAVWVGRADGASTPGLTGRAAAAPLLFDAFRRLGAEREDRKSTRLNSSHVKISYAVVC